MTSPYKNVGLFEEDLDHFEEVQYLSGGPLGRETLRLNRVENRNG